jgi:hypothetical protein
MQPFIVDVFRRLATSDANYMQACLHPLNADDRAIISGILR